jgi:hypothetical protein
MEAGLGLNLVVASTIVDSVRRIVVRGASPQPTARGPVWSTIVRPVAHILASARQNWCFSDVTRNSKKPDYFGYAETKSKRLERSRGGKIILE